MGLIRWHRPLGIVAANSPLASQYEALLAVQAEVRSGTLAIAKPLLLWINDGLMAVFFLLVGLEIEREFRAGELAIPMRGRTDAGVSFAGVGWANLLDLVTLGILLGLCIGKPVGIYGSLRLAVAAGLARLPEGLTWAQLRGVSILCGIGFTMSLFIGGLAWEHGDFDAPVRLGVIAGSLISALIGVLVLLTAKAAAPAQS